MENYCGELQNNYNIIHNDVQDSSLDQGRSHLSSHPRAIYITKRSGKVGLKFSELIMKLQIVMAHNNYIGRWKVWLGLKLCLG